MKKLLDPIRSFFARLGSTLTRRAGGPTASGEVAASAPSPKRKFDRFTMISWAVTVLIVIALLGSTFLYKNATASPALSPPQPTADTGIEQPPAGVPTLGSSGNDPGSILRELQLKTKIPERPRYKSLVYRVSRGDAMLSIAEQFKLKYESILYVNKQALDDNPHSLKPGMELLIPPVDGLYYEWKEGDTFDTVAAEFDAKPDDIINFPGNQIDLTDPKVEPGQTVMIPGGSRELRNWEADLITAARVNNGSTGTSDFGTNSCGGGLVASGFGWPADAHSLSGNGYGPGHLGIDITAPEGANVYAAGSGVVTMAQGGYNYGYGNVVQIDHGNNYVSVYAHLSQINVSVCQSVGQGALLGYAGSTGNAFGAHLHFEIRIGGKNVNPYDIVQ